MMYYLEYLRRIKKEKSIMKKIIIYLIAAVFMFVGISFADGGDKQGRFGQKYVAPRLGDKPPQYHGQGYRYQYYEPRQNPPQHYRGHWRSWQEWEDYHKHNRHMYQSERYYRDSQGRLYFEFETKQGRFAFSIGR